MSDRASIHVLIVDDHPLMRRGIGQMLALESAFHLVGEASNGSEALDLARRLDPDVILLDLNMKGLSGLETLRALRREGICARVIILTVSDAPHDILALVDAGADGYLLKDSDPEALLELIRHGAQHGGAWSDQVREYMDSRPAQAQDPLKSLTERELDVLQEVARGMSNKQIAMVLHISEETVKVHIRNLLRKMNVRSRVAATVLFLSQRGF